MCVCVCVFVRVFEVQRMCKSRPKAWLLLPFILRLNMMIIFLVASNISLSPELLWNRSFKSTHVSTFCSSLKEKKKLGKENKQNYWNVKRRILCFKSILLSFAKRFLKIALLNFLFRNWIWLQKRARVLAVTWSK